MHGAAPAPYTALDLIEGALGLVARGGLRRRGGGRRRAAAWTAGAGLALRLRPGRPPGRSAPPAGRRRAAPDPARSGLVGAGLMAAQLATLFLRRLEVPVAHARPQRGGARLGPRRRSRKALAEQVAKGRYDEGQGALPLLARLHLDELRRLRRLRPRARGGLRGARGQAAGLRRAARAHRARLRPRDQHLAASRSRRWAPTSASTSSTRSPCCRWSSSSARPSTDDADAGHRLGLRRGAAQARRCSSPTRRRSSSTASSTRLMSVVLRRARARHHRRGGGRGDPRARPADGARRYCCRWSGRASPTTCSRRSTSAYPDRFPLSPTLRELRRGQGRDRRPRAGDPLAATRSSRPRSRRSPTRSTTSCEEGVVAEAKDVDTALLLGAGWPFWLGGITKYLDQVGISDKMFGRPLAETGAGAPTHERQLAHPESSCARRATPSTPARPPRARLRLGRGQAPREGARRATGSRSRTTTTRSSSTPSRRPQAEQARQIVEAELADEGIAGGGAWSSTGSPRRSAGRASRRRRPGSRKRSSSMATRPGRCGSSCPSHDEADEARRPARARGLRRRAPLALPDRRRRAPRKTRTRSRSRVHGEAEPGGAGRLGGHSTEPVCGLRRARRLGRRHAESAMIPVRRSPTDSTRARSLTEIRGTATCCRHAGNDRATDAGAGGSGRPRRLRPPGRSMGRGALPPPGRRSGGRACARNGPAARARRRARRDGGGRARAVVRVEDPLRADARARAGAQPEPARARLRAPSCAATRSTRSPGC